MATVALLERAKLLKLLDDFPSEKVHDIYLHKITIIYSKNLLVIRKDSSRVKIKWVFLYAERSYARNVNVVEN